MTDMLWLLIGAFAGTVATWLLARRINAANAARIDTLVASEDKARKAADKLRRENEATKDAAAEAKRLRSELDALRARLADATSPLEARIAALEADVARRDRQIEGYRAEIDEREHRIAALRAERPAVAPSAEPAPSASAPELAAERERASAAEARARSEAKRADDAAARLQRESADSLKHQARILELKDAVDHLTRRFAERNRELDAAHAALAERDETIRALRGGAQVASAPAADEKAANARLVEAYRHDMAQRDRRIAQLEAALAAARSAGDSTAPRSASAPVRSRARTDGKPKGAAAAAAPIVAAGAPDGAMAVPTGASDDLTRIKGIGKVFASKLQGAGIATFADLAGADPAHLAAIVEPKAWQAVDFGAWIDQARELGER